MMAFKIALSCLAVAVALIILNRMLEELMPVALKRFGGTAILIGLLSTFIGVFQLIWQ